MAYDETAESFMPATASAVWTINRFGAMLGLNVGYLLIIVALAPEVGVVRDRAGILAVFFGAVILMKGQASVADAMHEYDVDVENPFKSHVPTAVDALGRENAMALFAVELTGSLALWGYLAYHTVDPLFLVAGVGSNVLAVTYSYPPRFKEWGVVNHLVTTGVDVLFVLLPGIVLAVGHVGLREAVVLGVVFTYVFAIHVMHQSGDTYYDAQSGIDTFTRSFGVENAVVLSFGGVGIAVAAAVCSGLFLCGGLLLGFAVKLQRIFADTLGRSLKAQSDVVSRRFDVSTWAPALNVVLALDLFWFGTLL